jgi:acyl-CoA thioesterase-1
MLQVAVPVAFIAGVIVCMYGYAWYHANKKPRNNPRAYLRSKAFDQTGKKLVVCIGDSITHGNVRCNYVDILSERLGREGFQFVNAGINSEHAYNVLQRLDEIIECKPDFVTILIGTNDSNKSRTEAGAKKAMRLMRLPQKPTAEWYRTNLIEICWRLKAGTNAGVAILSLPVITEDVNHPAFKHSLEYIEIIKDIAQDEKLTYLPLREKMTEIIRQQPSLTRYSFERRDWLTRKCVAQRFYMKKSWNDIAASNGFRLLIDFVHLNRSGAELVADLIEDFLEHQ